MKEELAKINNAVNATTEVAARKAAQEVQAQLIIAQEYPRDEQLALDKILNACGRKGLAETALYSYSKGGADISGPSIRLAETLVRYFKHINYGIRELENKNGESQMLAFAWDLENNIRAERVFNVKHFRDKRGGGVKLEDQRSIYELTANMGARRLRACILSLIPSDIVESAVAACDETLKATADVTPEGVKTMVEAFSKVFKVTKEQLEGYIQRRIDSITPAQVIKLRKIYASMKDDMSTPKDWFEVEKKSIATTAKKGVDGLKKRTGEVSE